MTQNDEAIAPPTLECSDLVYRLARKRHDLDPDSRRLSPAMFIRQSGYDDDGLSVVRGDTVTVEEAQIDGQFANMGSQRYMWEVCGIGA
jgi:hypothetical protein